MRGPFDAIFCRNVMIYFDQSMKAAAGGGDPARLLCPGGLFFVGCSGKSYRNFERLLSPSGRHF